MRIGDKIKDTLGRTWEIYLKTEVPEEQLEAELGKVSVKAQVGAGVWIESRRYGAKLVSSPLPSVTEPEAPPQIEGAK